MKKYYFSLFVLASFSFHGQEIPLPEIVPPSPTAYQLGSYGQIPVGTFTGTPNVSLPLYTYKTPNLDLPISLSYSSNGIKVDQLSSNVGLGWSFQAGGVISRIVRDKPDELRGVLIPEKELEEVGFNSAGAMNFFYAAGEADADTETDLYMYSFLGHSGKFVFDNRKHGIVMMPQTDLKVDVLVNGFKITTPDGISYSFEESETTRSRSWGVPQSPPEVGAITAWYLTKIEHPKGDKIKLIYDAAGSSFVYDANVSESIRRMVPNMQWGCNGSIIGSQYSPESVTTKVRFTAKRLSKIQSNIVDNGEILVESGISHPEISSYKMISRITIKDKSQNVKEKIDLSYYSTQNNRILLEGVQFLASDKNYSFEYYSPNSMPPRLSKSVDYFGYFNGKNNTHRYPNPQDPLIKPYIHPELWNIPNGADKSVDPSKAVYGLLKKVHYPTKGSNEFEYETGSHYSEVTHYPPLVQKSLYAMSEDRPKPKFVTDIATTSSIGYEQVAKFSIYVGPTECNDNTHTPTAMFSITDDQNNSIPIFTNEALTPQSQVAVNSFTAVNGSPSLNNNYFIRLLTGRTYTIKIKTMYWCVSTTVDFNYRPGLVTTTTENIPTGNLRIKRIKSFDTAASPIPESTMRYYYGKKETPEISSGQEGPRPYYITKSTIRENSGCYPGDHRDIHSQTLNSNSMRQLYNSSDIGTTSYKYVTISYGGDNFEGGGIEKEYFVMSDVQGNSLHGDPIEGSPWVNTGWQNGLLKKETIFKKGSNGELISLRKTEEQYSEDSRLFQKVYGYSVLKKFDLTEGMRNISYICTQEDLNSMTTYDECVAKHKHVWWIPSGNCIAPGHDNQTRYLYHACYGQYVGKLILYLDMIENLDIMEYSSNSYWFYKKSSTISEYDDGGNPILSTSIKYFYDNPEHLQQTRVEKTTNVDGKILITRTDYANDMYVQPLIDEYRIGEPIRVRSYQKVGTGSEELLSTQKTVYDNFGGLYLPQSLQTSKGTDNLENRLLFHNYDGHGNLREVSQPSGSRTVYVMGYNFTLPVAKLENVSLLEINQSWLNEIYNAANEGALLTALANLRANITNLNTAALVTTLTYKPLVGVHTITDPKNYMMTYEYDDFGRLKYVKDMEGNVLSENQYRYKND